MQRRRPLGCGRRARGRRRRGDRPSGRPRRCAIRGHPRRAGRVLAEADVRRRRGVPVTTPQADRRPTRCCASPATTPSSPSISSSHTGVVDLGSVRARAATARGRGSARATDERAHWPTVSRHLRRRRGLRLLIGRSTASRARRAVRRPARGPVRRPGGHRLARAQAGAGVRRLWHAEDGQFAKDRQRLNRLRRSRLAGRPRDRGGPAPARAVAGSRSPRHSHRPHLCADQDRSRRGQVLIAQPRGRQGALFATTAS